MSNKLSSYKPVEICGINVWPLRLVELTELAENYIRANKRLLIGVVNAAKIVNSKNDPELLRALHETDIVVADGIAVVWLSYLQGTPLPERVAGIDIMYALMSKSDRHGFRVFFLGAKPHVVNAVVKAAQDQYPGLQVAGYRDGYFDPTEEQEVAEQIKNSRADILFVAITPPKKEIFLRNWGEYMQVPVCHGVGGSFDVFAGFTKRAPDWMQRFGFEWLYRVWQEPRRMWKRYMVTNTLFIIICITTLIQRMFGKLPSQTS